MNKLIWPLILQEAKKEIKNLFYKHNIIVLEAAVLIQAEWQNECSEIWTCITSQNEVRLCLTDKLYFAYVYTDKNLFGYYIISNFLFYI